MVDRDTEHLPPCAGLREIERLHAVLAERVDGLEDWQRRTNGSVDQIRDDMRDMRRELIQRMDGNAARSLTVIAVATAIVQVVLKLAGGT